MQRTSPAPNPRTLSGLGKCQKKILRPARAPPTPILCLIHYPKTDEVAFDETYLRT
ncbi:hypothetical protein SBV1_90016 [Verrucomicrobia bacterium]|nr:hypothetical protein SBV1_90016 [Verrucomicrobiota bacterium]